MDQEPLRAWLAEHLGCPDLAIADMRPLGGGSIQENRLVRCRVGGGTRAFVLRMDAAATIASSRSRAEEFRILEAVWRAGVRVPEPVGFCADPAIIGAPFALMGLVEGVGLGPRIAKDLTLGGDRERLAETLGGELARIHGALDPRDLPAGLAFLGAPDPNPALAEIARLRASLDGIGARRPAIEWGLRWGESRAPDCPMPTLVHRDYRTGNYMVDASGLDRGAGLGIRRLGRSGSGSRVVLRRLLALRPTRARGRRHRLPGGLLPGLRGCGRTADRSGARGLLGSDGACALGGDRAGAGRPPRLRSRVLPGAGADRPHGARPRTRHPPGDAPGNVELSMQDDPSGAALLDAARRALTEEVVPGLEGRPRYVALMVANAIGIAAREIAEADRLQAASERVLAGDGVEALVRAIRAGARDADPDLHAALSAATQAAAEVWKPARSER